MEFRFEKHQGTIYLNGSRYWWKVRFPGDSKFRHIPLRLPYQKFATNSFAEAEQIANKLWADATLGTSVDFDGKLSSLITLYLNWAKNYYRQPSMESDNIRWALSPLLSYCGEIKAKDFTPKQLKLYRDHVISTYDWCISTINRRITTIVKMFQWAVSEEFVNSYTWQSLQSVESLKSRYCDRRIRLIKKVMPIELDRVNLTLKHLSPTLQDMVNLQLLTAMRPGEMVKIRPENINRSGEIWLYTPKATSEDGQDHKTAHYGHDRTICIGPKAQAILTKYLRRPTGTFCFQPEEVVKSHREERYAARRTIISCGNKPGSNRKGTQYFNPFYSVEAYRKAIQRACNKAFPAPNGISKEDRKKWIQKNQWSPHQLRHTMATEIRSQFNPDDARAVLGHTTLSATEIYAEMDLRKAINVAKSIG